MNTDRSIIFLHPPDQMNRIRFYYKKYLERKHPLFFLSNENLINGNLDYAQLNRLHPLCLIYADTGPVPFNIYDSPWPTFCFHIDTFSTLKNRINISRLFDVTIVFHPEFKILFERHGIKTEVLTHAIDHECFRHQDDKERQLEVAFIGDIKRNNYSVRRNFVKVLPSTFKTNDFSKYYEWEEMIKIYTNSRIVVNIGRNDYLKDANLRCFEAMASGALLFSLSPAELSELGYIEGTDFVGFDDQKGLIEKINHYLLNKDERKKIAANGQIKTLKFHNYQLRIDQLLKILNDHHKFERKLDGYQVNLIFYKDSIVKRNHKQAREFFIQLFRLNAIRALAVSYLLLIPFFSGLKNRSLNK